MSVIITCQSLTKSFSARPLFKQITFAIDEDDRVGLIGPNGAGKSTLLKILAGLAEPDDGQVVTRRNLNTAYLAQDNVYAPGLTLRQVVGASLAKIELEEAERNTRIEVQLTRMGFADLDAQASLLSGGWRKRLALAAELVKEPEFLLLDEPTNHLDLEGVLWLEELLGDAPFAYMIVSHDRSFLENLTNRTIELNPTYRDGFLSVPGPYSSFLQAHQEALATQAHEQQALESQVRREIAWLQRGARARQTKSTHRIREAGKLIEELEQAKSRATKQTADIDFSASGRRTKELIVLKGVSKSMGGKRLFGGLDITLCPGSKLGVLGANGSGKTTLLRILAGRLEPDGGTIKRAPDLQVVWFDQNREQLDKSITLKEALCAEGDSVVYQGRSLHVASWSRRFLFRPDQLPMPISYLSGGEQARILIARLMLQPADILVLDEPTNDLDISTLTVLEESLLEFPGVIVLVTHDRLLLDTVSTNLLALDGEGKAEFFADYAQFEQHREKSLAAKSSSKSERTQDSKAENRSPSARTLSTGEKKELAQMEAKISKAEEKVSAIKLSMENPEVVRNHVRLGELMSELQQAESAVAALYERWEELENRQAALS